ncbi:MAG: hypothetical protein ABIJ46_01800 [bacterium]
MHLFLSAEGLQQAFEEGHINGRDLDDALYFFTWSGGLRQRDEEEGKYYDDTVGLGDQDEGPFQNLGEDEFEAEMDKLFPGRLYSALRGFDSTTRVCVDLSINGLKELLNRQGFSISDTEEALTVDVVRRLVSNLPIEVVA